MSELATKASGEFWILIGSGIGLALAAVLLALIGTLREWLFKLVPKILLNLKKSSPNRKDAEQNHKVYTELVEMRALTDADRAYVLRFHNGSEFFPDNPVWKISCSHEVVRDGISYESAKLQEILVSRVHSIVDSIITGEVSSLGVKMVDCFNCQFKPKCDQENKHVVIIQVDEMESSYAKFMLESHNVKTIIQSGMVSRGKVFGIVGIDICDCKLKDDDLIRETADKVCKIAEKIQYHLLFRDIPFVNTPA